MKGFLWLNVIQIDMLHLSVVASLLLLQGATLTSERRHDADANERTLGTIELFLLCQFAQAQRSRGAGTATQRTPKKVG